LERGEIAGGWWRPLYGEEGPPFLGMTESAGVVLVIYPCWTLALGPRGNSNAQKTGTSRA
jgi:hypothetical protein